MAFHELKVSRPMMALYAEEQLTTRNVTSLVIC